MGPVTAIRLMAMAMAGALSFLYLVSPLLVVVGILGLFSLSWALRTRPSRRQVRDELYGFLLFAGAVAASYCVLVPCAQLFARSRLVLVPCGLCWALRDGVSHPPEV